MRMPALPLAMLTCDLQNHPRFSAGGARRGKNRCAGTAGAAAHLQLDAVLVGGGQARLVGRAAQPELVAVGAVAHEAQFRHVRPRAPVRAACGARSGPVSTGAGQDLRRRCRYCCTDDLAAQEARTGKVQ